MNYDEVDDYDEQEYQYAYQKLVNHKDKEAKDNKKVMDNKDLTFATK